MAITNESYFPSEYNTGVIRGDDFSEMFTFTIENGEAFPLIGATGKVQIRTSMNVSLGEWTEENGLIFEDNVLTWFINDTETATFQPGAHYYDIEISIGGQKRTYVKGIFNVIKDITV